MLQTEQRQEWGWATLEAKEVRWEFLRQTVSHKEHVSGLLTLISQGQWERQVAQDSTEQEKVCPRPLSSLEK